jgi:hypothetical protein
MTRFIKGNVIASPEIANGPTPCPINMLSIILYREVATLAIIAGTEYCINNFPIDSVPNVIGVFDDVSAIFLKILQN